MPTIDMMMSSSSDMMTDTNNMMNTQMACSPCTVDNECVSLGEGARCTALSTGNHCTPACDDQENCPDGYSCLTDNLCIPNGYPVNVFGTFET